MNSATSALSWRSILLGAVTHLISGDMMNIDRRQIIERIVERLITIQQRPNAYIDEILGPVGNFLVGLDMVCEIIRIMPDPDISEQVFLEHGWKPSAFGADVQMRKKGFTEQQIIDELLSMEVEIWKRTLDAEPK